jgi:hypothetical protein
MRRLTITSAQLQQLQISFENFTECRGEFFFVKLFFSGSRKSLTIPKMELDASFANPDVVAPSIC